MPLSKKNSLIISIILFCVLMSLGYQLSAQKPLWTDEIFTQTAVVDKLNYGQILRMEMEGEDNRAPLFYLIQESVSRLTNYRLPYAWDGYWSFADRTSQIVMRISSNILMSLAIVILFYFFARQFSLGVGLYALLVSFSSYMVWAYWVEARPYSLWFLLTVCQLILFLRIVIKPEKKCFICLGVINIALSLTILFSIFQILICSLLLWIYKQRGMIKHLCVTGVPVLISLFYFYHSMGLNWWSEKAPSAEAGSVWTRVQETLTHPGLMDDVVKILHSISLEQIIIMLVYAGMALFYQKGKRQWSMKPLIPLGLMLFLSSFVILAVFLFGTNRSVPGLAVTPRYFIYLAPYSILAVTVFSVELLKNIEGDRWMRINILIGLGGLLVLRSLHTFMDITEIGIY